jgi:hypothetical protein
MSALRRNRRRARLGNMGPVTGQLFAPEGVSA